MLDPALLCRTGQHQRIWVERDGMLVKGGLAHKPGVLSVKVAKKSGILGEHTVRQWMFLL